MSASDTLTTAKANLVQFIQNASTVIAGKGGDPTGVADVGTVLSALNTLSSYERTISTYTHTTMDHPVVTGNPAAVKVVQDGMSLKSLIINGKSNQTITSQGKNLFDNAKVTSGYVENTTGTVKTTSYNNEISNMIKVSASTAYTLSGLTYTQPTGNVGLAWYDSTLTYISGVTFSAIIGNGTYTSPANAAYLRFTVNSTNLGTSQLEQGSSATSYAAFVPDSPSSYYPADITSLNSYTKTNSDASISVVAETNVDLYNLPDGTYDTEDVISGSNIQKIKEIILNGTESWSVKDNTKTNTISFEADTILTNASVTDYANSNTKMICSHFSAKSSSNDEEYISLESSGTGIIVSIYKDQLSTKDVAGFKAWLTLNNVDVLYELATPITSTDIAQTIPIYTGETKFISENGVSAQLNGTIHKLDGDGYPHIQFTATADFAKGDTFEINSIEVPGIAQTGAALPNKFFRNGYWVLDAFNYDLTLYFLSSLANSGGYLRSTTAPDNTELLWVDQSDNNSAKFYNTVTSTWDKISSGNAISIKDANSGTAKSFWWGNQAAFDAITTKDVNTTYFVDDDAVTDLAAKNEVPLKTLQDTTYYVDAINGNDSNDGSSSNTAFKTVQHAIDLIPQVVNHNVTINVITGTYSEDITLSGFTGKGSITLQGGTDLTSAANYKINSVTANQSDIGITINGINTNYHFISCKRINVNNIFSSSATISYGILVCSSQITLSTGVISNKTDAIQAIENSIVSVFNLTGSSNTNIYTADSGSRISILDFNSINNFSSNNLFNITRGGLIIEPDGTSTSGATFLTKAWLGNSYLGCAYLSQS